MASTWQPESCEGGIVYPGPCGDVGAESGLMTGATSSAIVHVKEKFYFQWDLWYMY
jgi:hypothetical protein